jgi:HAE1 family hydrophobic/amphiphilic exporter-1
VLGGSGAARSRAADRVVLPELARVDGAGRIEVVGATPLVAAVRPRAADLAARKLTAADVERRLRGLGRSLTAGRVREGAIVRPAVVTEPVESIDVLRRVTVGSAPLVEVADVFLQELPDDTIFRMASKDLTARDGVLLRVYRAPNANAVALARGVRGRVSELGTRLRDVQLHVVADRSGEVSRALIELALAAVAGVLLGTIILRWMIGHWTPTLALSVVIPAALLASFTAFYAAGVPLDVISLSGLALATGLLVDNSIVVLESIESARAGGSRDPVLHGTRQIMVAVVASSATLIIVFAPLLYLRGLARAIFGEQAIAVVVSVAASLVLSLTLTPVLARRHVTATPRHPGLRQYEVALTRAMQQPRVALIIALITLGIGLGSGFLLRRELFARGEERNLAIDVRIPSDVDNSGARARLNRVWSAAVSGIDAGTVTAMWATRPAAGKTPSIDILFKSSRAARDAAVRIRERLHALGDGTIDVRTRPSAFIEAIGGKADRVELIASAATEREAGQLSQRVLKAMRDRNFRLASENATSDRRLAVALDWDDRLLSANNIDRRGVENDVHAALGNIDAGHADIAAAEPAIRLLPTTPQTVATIPVRVQQGIVPLGAIAELTLKARAPDVRHDDRRPARRLVFEGGDANAVAEAVASVAPQRSERVRVAGHARELADAFAQMRLALVLAALLLYLTVAAFYESLLLPLPVIAALPFAGAGAFAALAITGQSLNLMSLLGLIFLGGVVVNHTVVLLDRVEQLRAEGIDEDEAIRRAAADRYRPVIMTTLTAVVGMLPLALLGGPGVELRRSIAVVVIGGLITATVGTLVLIPLLHRALEPLRRRAPAPRNAARSEIAHA